jgi:YggT family protein
MDIVALIIHRIFQLIILILIVQAILSFFMSPFDPIRRTLDRFVNPMLAPIRRFVHPVGNLDFSPLILIILLQILDTLLTRILISL